MGFVFLSVRLLVAGTFLIGAVGKLADRKGTLKALNEFGVRVPLTISFILPLSELIVCIMLLSDRLARWGGLGALLLLSIFTIAVALNLARGRKPNCHCFGQFHSAPIGWKTLVQNGFLALGAGFVMWGSATLGPNSWEMPNLARGLYVVTAGFGVIVFSAVLVQAWAMLHLLRQHGRLLVRLDNLELRLASAGILGDEHFQGSDGSMPIGSAAPRFEAPKFPSGTLSLYDLVKRAKPVLLIFTSLRCGPCKFLLPHVAQWQAQHADALTIAIVSRGSEEDHRRELSSYGLSNVILQKDFEIAEKFGIRATPAGVLINAEGSIASNVVAGPQAIADLLARATIKRVHGLAEPRPTHQPEPPRAGKKLGWA